MTKFVRPILSILFVNILIFQYYIFVNSDNKTFAVFYEETSDINNYSNYLIDFKDNLTTKNLIDKISLLGNNKYEIKKLYLKTNEIWNEQVKVKLSEYSYDTIENFVSYYKNILKKYNLADEIPNIDISGIIVDKILIYTSKESIELLSKNYNIEYEKK